MTWILLCTIVLLLHSHFYQELKTAHSMGEIRINDLWFLPSTKPNHQQNQTKPIEQPCSTIPILLSQLNFNSNSTWVSVTWILLCTIIPLLCSRFPQELIIRHLMVERRIYDLGFLPLTKPNDEPNQTKPIEQPYSTKPIFSHSLTSTPIQLELVWLES